ncbi:MAG: TolC family protein, partial [Planctomycetaceae bacterium]|nr:TolC family protein [Planctomycetaceae bacterium]
FQKAENDALRAAYRAAFTHKKYKLMNDLTKIAHDSQQAGEQLFQSKEISRPTFLDIKIQLERTKLAKKNAEIAYQTASRELAVLLGLPENEIIEITDSIENLPDEMPKLNMWIQLKTASPEMHKAYSEVKTAQAKLKQQIAEAGLDYDINTKIAYNTETKYAEITAGVAIPIRIFNRNHGNIQQARSELAAAQKNVERLEKLLEYQFEKLWGEYLAARNSVVSYRGNILQESEESLKAAQKAYRQGEYNTLELLDVQRTFAAVNAEYLDSMNRLIDLHILLEGAMLAGGLEQP